MIKRICIICCLFALLCSSSLAGPLPRIEFGEVFWYGRSGVDFASDVIALSDGGFLLVGWSMDASNEYMRAWAARANAQGEIAWEFFKEVEGRYCIFLRTAVLPDGRFVLLEGIWPACRLLFVTPEGELDGGMALPDDMVSFYPLEDGFIANGQDTSQVVRGGWPNFVQRLDASGSLVWEHVATLYHDEVYRCLAPADDGVLLGGLHRDEETGYIAPMVCKLGMDGEIVFSYAGEPVSGIHRSVMSVAQAHDGGIIAAGYTFDQTNEQDGGFVLRVDQHGELMWQNELMPDTDVQLLLPLADGRYLVGTHTLYPLETDEYTSLSPWLLLIDEDGKVLAEGFPAEPFGASDSMTDMLRAPDGSIYVYGAVYGEELGGIAVVRVDLPEV